MECQKCGAELKEGTKFYLNCGTKIKFSHEKDISPVKNNKRNKKIITPIIFRVLILVALMCTVGCGNTSSNNVSKANNLEMINVLNMSYPDALKLLQDTGFSNIVSNVSSDTNQNSWFVTEQSVSAGKQIHSDDKVKLICAMKCNLYLDITSNANLLFSTYDISISLDGEEIGTVANGKEFTYLAEVLSGNHKLAFCKSGDTSPNGSKKIKVNGDMTYSCTLSHDSDAISVENESKENNVKGANLEVPDVTGDVLSNALKTLDEMGFSNVREEPYNNIWDKDNWIVTKQGIEAGSIIDKNEFIQLDCISLDDYFNENYVGKNIIEIQNLAEMDGFTIQFEDLSGEDLNSLIADFDEDTKKSWIAIDVHQFGGTDKTVFVTLQNTEESETPMNSSVSYSTNSKETVKDGNAGVYAYKNIGGMYDVYYIIDFDEGYVYYFTDGDGSGECDRIKIDSGTLNDAVTITYHAGDETWQEKLYFKWSHQPEHLIVYDSDQLEWDYYSTDLNSALKKRNSKTIIDY